MFSSFRAYDDEGYYLATLHDYLAGHPLLTSYSQVYGPFFYELFGGLFRVLGLPADNDSGRVVTAVLWILASLGCGLVAYRLTRNLWLGVAAQLLAFGLLAAMTNEPMGTYGIASILVLVVVWAAALRASRPRLTAAVIGAAVGALILVKINVGGLAAIAVVFAWAASLENPWRRWVLVPLVGAMAALPFVLMSALLAETWVVSFATVVAVSIAAIGVAVPARPSPPSIPWFITAAGVVAVLSIGIALATGTHAGDLWSGLVTAGLRYPQLFTVPLSVGPVHVVVAALALLVAALRRPLGGLVRVGAGFFTLLSLVWMPNAIFMAALPLAWMGTQPPEGDDPAGSYVRALLPALAVLQTLQAYPIAGTQASMAGFCMIPVGALILGDGLRQLAAAPVRGVALVAPAAVALNAVAVAVLALVAVAGFVTGEPLGVPGARLLRLPPGQAANIRAVVAAIDANCSSFITFPSMSSLYVWTEQDPPTPVRVPIWWLILDDGQQRSAVSQLEGKPRVCVVENRQVLAMRSMDRPIPSTPLVDFIGRSFVHQGSYGDYELLVSSSP